LHRISAYVTLALIFIMAISILYLPILFFLKKRGVAIIRQLSCLALFCSSFLIVFATILFTPITFTPEIYILNITPFDWLNNANMFVAEVIPNIMMFIPLGIFVPIVFAKTRKFYKTAVIALLVTFSVEAFQYFIGRSSDIDDIIANLAGGIIGYGIFKFLNILLKNKIWWSKLLGNNLTA